MRARRQGWSRTRLHVAGDQGFESPLLQQRVRCELDLAARKSQKRATWHTRRKRGPRPRAAEAAGLWRGSLLLPSAVHDEAAVDAESLTGDVLRAR